MLLSECQMDGREVWRLELRKLSLWETHPSGGVINLGLLFDPAPLGILSSSSLDLLLIRLLVKTLKAPIPQEHVMLCMSMLTQKMGTQTPPLIIMHL